MDINNPHHRNLFVVMTALNGATAVAGDLRGKLVKDGILASTLIGNIVASAGFLSGVTDVDTVLNLTLRVTQAFQDDLRSAIYPTDDVEILKSSVTRILDAALRIETSTTLH